MLQKNSLFGLILTTAITSNYALAEENFLDRNHPLSKVDTLQLCIDYANLTRKSEQQAYIKELDLRSQLSVKDHQLIDKHQAENSMTRCGMYMALGKPISEQSRQIRPMTFKTVHVYSNKYYVSQSGMIVETLDRKADTLPPQLIPTVPKVVPPPIAPKHL